MGKTILTAALLLAFASGAHAGARGFRTPDGLWMNYDSTTRTYRPMEDQPAPLSHAEEQAQTDLLEAQARAANADAEKIERELRDSERNGK
jgi:hypothetical protein